MGQTRSRHLQKADPGLLRVLRREDDGPSRLFAEYEILHETFAVTMRDGVRLATDIYLPPRRPAPAVVMRTPYGRGMEKFTQIFVAFARCGYAVVAQDCRGTGQSEPKYWDYYMYESEDSLDLIEWISGQAWCDGFIGACGGSYAGQTQWCMAAHPRMSTIVPEVSGLGLAINTAHIHMFVNAYARSVGKGASVQSIHYGEQERLMLEETLGGGYFNEPLHLPIPESLLARYPELRYLPPTHAKKELWEKYCALTCAQRAAFVTAGLGTTRVSILDVERLSSIFGQSISHDAHSIPHAHSPHLCRSLHGTALIMTGWYDWGLNDALATWMLLTREAREPMRSRCRLVIAPSAHNVRGYHEGVADHPELQHNHRTENNIALLLRWYAAVRGETVETWPNVVYYLMGANEWRAATDWPLRESQLIPLYLGAGHVLTVRPPVQPSEPDQYTYNPEDPTPTIGGSILSYVYRPGSVDVSELQKRPDVLTYTTGPLERSLDVVGPLRLILYAASDAVDTDFCARLSDVFPDGRAIQLQSGILRARYRNIARGGEPELLEPGRVYCLEIDMWATANRFQQGHHLRVDISSADFPRFDRNSNRGGTPGSPIAAVQSVYHDPQRPSHLLVSAINGVPKFG